MKAEWERIDRSEVGSVYVSSVVSFSGHLYGFVTYL